MKVGVGITTRNRPGVLHEALTNHLKHHKTTSEVELAYYLVNDSSEDITAPWHYLANLECWVWQPKDTGIHLGIARAKNLCLTHLMGEGCDHIFLFDDDAWPISDYWYEPFINHHEPHLQASFSQGTTHSAPLVEYYRDTDIVAYHRSRGYCLYYDRKVIERVGGFDERFQYGMEHLEHSRRIHNAGLTLFEHQDINQSSSLIHSCDAEDRVESPSVITSRDRHMNMASNLVLYAQTSGSDAFVDYQPARPVVLTCLLTQQLDEQRGKYWDPDPAQAATLLTSLEQHEVDFRVFYDNDETVAGFDDVDDRWVRVNTSISPYLQRWIAYRQYLMDTPEHRWVWCVDATDVELLQDPWYGLKPNTLYCGWENEVCSRPWMLNHHSASRHYLETKVPDEMLLNPGVVGGDRKTVMQLCDNIIHCYAQGKIKGLVDEAGDMGYFQEAARQLNYSTGPAVTTLFKGYESINRHAIWRHK